MIHPEATVVQWEVAAVVGAFHIQKVGVQEAISNGRRDNTGIQGSSNGDN